MKIIEQSVSIIDPLTREDAVRQLKLAEYAGRTCYASRDKTTDDSYEKFVTNLLMHGHTSPLEFGTMTAELVTSRAVMAEITRHRLANFCIQSQRYVNEGKGGVAVIKPWWLDKEDTSPLAKLAWRNAQETAEAEYQNITGEGLPPEAARSVLTNDTATIIVMKANFVEWRHIFDLRTSIRAFPQMRLLMKDLVEEAASLIPVVFDDYIGFE